MTFRPLQYICVKCGRLFFSWSGRVKWCPECRPEQSRIADRKARLKWHRKHGKGKQVAA